MSDYPDLLADWARQYLDGSSRERMGWINTRHNDLLRILGSTKQAAIHVLDYGGDIAELERAIQSPEERLAHLRRHIEAVRAARDS